MAEGTETSDRQHWARLPSDPSSASRFWQSLGKAHADLARGIAPHEVWHDLLQAILAASESQFGFLGEVLNDEEGAPYLKIHALTNTAWSPETRRLYDEQGRTGLEFRNLRNLFCACLTTESVVVANDPGNDERSGGLPEGHLQLDAFLGIPLVFEERMVGMAGVANRRGGYDEALVHELQPFLDTMATLTVFLRKEAELRTKAAVAAETKANLSAIVNAAAAAIITIDERGTILSTNPASVPMLGYSPEELRGKNLSILMPEPHRSHHGRYIASYLETGLAKVIGTGREVEAVRKDGSVLFAHLSLGEVRQEGKRIFTGVLQDVTARHQAQRKLEESLADLRKSQSSMLSIFNQLEVGVMCVDESGRVEFVNQASAVLPDESGAEVLGQPWEKVLVMDEDSRQRFRELINAQEGSVTRHPFRIRNKAGVLRHVDIDVRADPRDATKRIVFLYDVSEVRALRYQLERQRHGQIIGSSNAMAQLYREIDQVADGDWSVLIAGETGTGKELVALAVHAASRRRDAPFVAVNCAGLEESLVWSELFGHVKGAFTDATSDRQGVFEAADGGTLFLDEIGDMRLGVQGALLRAVQEKKIRRVGEALPRAVDVRLVAATNKNLVTMVAMKLFREDLLYRLRVGRIIVPPLRDRRNDIPALAAFFLAKVRVGTGKLIRDVSPNALECLMRYQWPGNVRELSSALEFAAMHCRGPMIRPEDLPPEISTSEETAPQTQEAAVAARVPVTKAIYVRDPQAQQNPVPATLASVPHEGQEELTRILAAIEWAEGNRARAARKLGISSATLYRRLARYAIPAKRARLAGDQRRTGRPQT